MNKEIVIRIKTIIDHYGLSVSAFADTIGVQRSSISHLLNGRNKPSLDFVLKLADSYPEVNLYWLLHGKGKFPAEENQSVEAENTPTLDFENISDKSETQKEQPKTSKPRHQIKDDEPEKIVFLYADGTFTTFSSKND